MSFRIAIADPYVLVEFGSRLEPGEQEQLVAELSGVRGTLGHRAHVLLVVPPEFSIPGPDARKRANGSMAKLLHDSCETISVVVEARGLIGELTRTLMRGQQLLLPEAQRSRVYIVESVDAALLRLVRHSSRTVREVMVELGLE